MTVSRIVGIVLARDEDIFVERAVRNVVDFCDELLLVDHQSRDGTPAIFARLENEFPHVRAYRVEDPSASHELIKPYAGSPTWVLGVDGDELYDPGGLRRLRRRLRSGEFQDRWVLRSIQLHCRRLDVPAGTASGWLAPPSRATTKLYNFGLLESWEGPVPERLHGGTPVFRGSPDDRIAGYVEYEPWDRAAFRCLHTCFLHRSSRQPRTEIARYDFGERGEGGRRLRTLKRVRRLLRLPDASQRKLTQYTQGEEVEVGCGEFFAASDADRLPPAIVNVWR